MAEDLEVEASGATSGVGLGWVQGARSLLRTNPKPAPNSAGLLDLMADVPARSVLGYVRHSDDSSRPMQPFRFRKWVFSHAGETPRVDESLDTLLEGVPEFIRGNIKEKSAEAIFFHAFLGRLHSRNLLEAVPIDAQAAAEALAESAGEIQRAAAVADLQIVTASERTLIAARLGSPLFYKMTRGLEVPVEAPMFAGHRPKMSEFPAFRSLVLANADERPGPDWAEVPDRKVLWLDDNWEPRFVDIV